MILEKEYQKRKREVRKATINSKLNGIEVSEFAKEQLNKWCFGEIKVNDITKEIIEKYKKD